jgi:hypothetical protein
VRTFEYLDFDLLLERGREEGSYRARVLTAPSGPSAPSEFRLPWSDLELENFLLKIGRPRRATRGSLASSAATDVQRFGAELYDALFSPELRMTLATSITQAESRNAGLRVRLRLADVPELADVPWEFLWSADQRLFMALSEWTPLVRYLDLPGAVRPLEVSPPLRVLVLAASPSDLAALDADAERARLRDALADLERRNLVVVDTAPEGTLAALQRMLRRQDYHVVHFIGHGMYDAAADVGVLAFEGPDGRSQEVQADHVAMLLHDHRTLRLAVLNSCEGARGGLHDPYAGTAQTLVRQGVPAVVAMQFEITDDAAVVFAQTLYEAIADGYPLDAATAQARMAIRNDGNPVEWATPVLYLRSPDGQIFDVADTSRPAEDVPDVTDDADYVAARACAMSGNWAEAARLLALVHARHPEDDDVAARLTDARRKEQLDLLDMRARAAAEEGRWSDTVFALERVVEVDPGYRAATQRLEDARNELAVAQTPPPPVPEPDPLPPKPHLPVPPVPPVAPWWRRWPALVAAALVVLALGGAAAFVLGRSDDNPGSPLPRGPRLVPNQIVITTGDGVGTVAAPEPSERPDPGATPHLVVRVEGAESAGLTRDRRTLTWVKGDVVWVAASDGTRRMRLPDSGEGDCRYGGRPAWGPGDDMFVQRCGRDVASQGLFRRDVDGGDPRPLVRADGRIDPRGPTVSADGELVAYWTRAREGGHSGGLQVVRIEDKRVMDLLEGGAADPAWSPEDDRRLAYISKDADGRRLHVATVVVDAAGTARLEDDHRVGDLTGVSRPTWSPDGSRLAFRKGDGIYVLAAAGGPADRIATVEGTGVSPVWFAR